MAYFAVYRDSRPTIRSSSRGGFFAAVGTLIYLSGFCVNNASTHKFKVIRAPRWPAALSGGGALVLGVSGIAAWWAGGFSWLALSGFALSLLCLLGVADALTTRVELHNDCLVIVANLRSRTYPKSSFAKVAWAKGAPPALQLSEGSWVILPKALPGGLGPANTLKAWLKG